MREADKQPNESVNQEVVLASRYDNQALFLLLLTAVHLYLGRGIGVV